MKAASKFLVLFLATSSLLSCGGSEKSSLSGATLANVSLDSSDPLASLAKLLGDYKLTEGDTRCQNHVRIGFYTPTRTVSGPVFVELDSIIQKAGKDVVDYSTVVAPLSAINSGEYHRQLHGIDPKARLTLENLQLNVSLRGKKFCYSGTWSYPCGVVVEDVSIKFAGRTLSIENKTGVLGRAYSCSYKIVY